MNLNLRGFQHAVCFLWTLIVIAPATHAGVTWQLVETIPGQVYWPTVKLANGSVTDTGQVCQAQVTWNPPGTMDETGVGITFNTQAKCTGSNRAVSASISGTGGVTIQDSTGANVAGRELAGIFVNGPNGPKNSGSASAQVRVRPPSGNVRDGDSFTLNMGMSFFTGMTYRFRATVAGTGNTGGNNGDSANRRLAARLECPSTVVIGALPSLNCHILISGWRRNTADAVEVLLPQAVDTFGNHGNGIQVLGRGSENVFNWDDPTHSWGLFVYACQAPNIGANCYNNVTTPGPKTVPIIVRQRDATIRLDLNIMASARAGSGGTTTTGGTTIPTNAGRLRAELECPGSIVIGALPSLNCHLLISGWQRNTATPVEVILPNALDTFGNHANGIQVLGRGSENISNWDGSTHSWGLFVYACQARNIGANCYNNVTTPGPQTVVIIVRQGNRQERLDLMITAVGQRGPIGGTTTSFRVSTSTDRPGSDYRNFWQSDARWESCQQACEADATCQSFTYVRPGFQGPRARCWLKNNIPAASRNDCCTSGVKTTGIR